MRLVVASESEERAWTKLGRRGAWGMFPYLLGLGLGGALRCLMQMPSLDAKARKAG